MSIIIMEIFEESDKIIQQLNKLSLLKQYIAAKRKLISGGSRGLDLKLREPKHSGIYSFRINQQYRAYAVEKDGALIVFQISDHQN